MTPDAAYDTNLHKMWRNNSPLNAGRLVWGGCLAIGAVGRSADVAGESIADAAHGLDEGWLRGAAFDFLAQTGDLIVDGPVEGGPAVPTYEVHELLPGEDSLGAFEQNRQELEVAAGEGVVTPVAIEKLELVGNCDHAVEMVARRFPAGRLRLGGQDELEFLGAPQDAAHPGDEFADVEGLGDVVVGPNLEPNDTVDHVVFAGDHNDGRGEVFADVLGDFESAFLPEIDVERDEIDGFAVQSFYELLPGFRFSDDESSIFQSVAQQSPDLGVVIDHDNGLLCHLPTFWAAHGLLYFRLQRTNNIIECNSN